MANTTTKKWLEKRAWDMRRFGLLPPQLLKRATRKDGPHVLCISIPKSGTHLLERALCLHPELYRRTLPTVNNRNIGRFGGPDGLARKIRPGEIVFGHLHYSDELREAIERENLHTVFMVRDPRDIVVSQANYLIRKRMHRRHNLFKNQHDLESRLELAIRGHAPSRLLSIAGRMDQYKPWLEAAGIVVRFEDLIGESGGKSGLRQRETLRALFGYLGVSTKTTLIEKIAGKLYSSLSPTFHKGRAGGWISRFTPRTLDIFREVAGNRLDLYGYEDSDIVPEQG